MAKKLPERALIEKYLCFHGGRVHRAYIHSNMGAAIIWCPKHGILCSITHRVGVVDNRCKQMTEKQYEKFVGMIKKKSR